MSKSYSPAGYAPVETRNLKQSPNCYFYVNGDQHGAGSKYCVSHKYRSFDILKDELTKTLYKGNHKNGFIREVCTPQNGTRIRDLSELQDGQHYVACLNNERFKKMDYKDIAENTRHGSRRKNKQHQEHNDTITPVVHAPIYKDRHGKALAEGRTIKGIPLRLAINNNNSSGYIPFTIQYRIRDNLDAIIDDIERQLGVLVKSLYTIENEGLSGPQDFRKVCDCSDFFPNAHVLVVGKGKPIFKPYRFKGLKDFEVRTSPRAGLFYNYPDFQTTGNQFKHNLSLNRQKVLPSISSGSNKHSEPYSPFSNAGSHGGRRNNKQQRRPKQVDYDKDDAGVYRAKKQNNARGAQQERVNEEAGMHHNDENGDDSFNRYGYEPNSPRGQSKDDYDRRSPRGQSKNDNDRRSPSREDNDRRSPPRNQSRDDYDRRSPPRDQNKDIRSSTPASRGQSRQGKEIKEHKAATKIQAGARGYLTRKKVAADKQNKQANNRQTEDDNKAQQNSQNKAMDEDAAASKIQASFKGYKTRKEISSKKQQGQK